VRAALPVALALVPLLPAAAGATVAFSRADANHDGFVTYEEAVRVFPKLARVHFAKCDPDGNGRIDQLEYPLLDNFYWVIYKNRN
jgi:hypothetical protein